MANDPNALISLDGVTKVFVTDEVETHALAGIHLHLKKGEYLSIAGPSGCGKSTLLAILGLLDSPTDGTYILNGKAGARPEAFRARAHPQPRDRIHFPGVQPDRRPDCVRERRTAAHLSRHAVGGAQEARSRCTGTRRHVAPHQALSVAALGRSATARRRGARARQATLPSCWPTSRPETWTPPTAKP